MNSDQKRHLATTLRLMEKNLAHKDRLLRSQGEKGVLYQIVDSLCIEQRQALLARIAKLRECIVQLKKQFNLSVEQINVQQMLTGEFNMLWIWLQDAKAKKLKGYGVVDPRLEQDLDPLLAEMAELIDTALKTLVNSETGRRDGLG